MVFRIYTCEDCDEAVSVSAKKRILFPRVAACQKCGGRALSEGAGRVQNAGAGEIISDNLGCGYGQEAEFNRDLDAAGINAHYREGDGALVAANRQAFQETLAVRGMMSHTDGGSSSKKMHRLRESSRRGNPR